MLILKKLMTELLGSISSQKLNAVGGIPPQDYFILEIPKMHFLSIFINIAWQTEWGISPLPLVQFKLWGQPMTIC
jgi:hypothetical protein